MHVALAILIVVGLPLAKKKLAPIPPPVAIEIVTIAEVTNPPKGKKRPVKAKKPTPKPPQARQAAAPKKPEPKPKPPVKKVEKPKPKPEPPVKKVEKPKPKPEPPVKKAEKPKPKPEPKKEPEVASLPKPQAKKEPPPKPDQKPQAAPPAPQPRVKAKPAPKPKARPRPRKRMSLAQALESANKLKPRAKTARRERETQTARRGSPRHDASQKLSMSELDALKRQIERCWNFPAGARNARDLVVEIRVLVNRDRTVRQASIVDVARMRRDPFYRSAAESARRAVLNPRCSPLKLPPAKYDLWRSMTLRFDPREAFGG
jgi:outer membrane biosynthesis protein TonB